MRKRNHSHAAPDGAFRGRLARLGRATRLAGCSALEPSFESWAGLRTGCPARPQLDVWEPTVLGQKRVHSGPPVIAGVRVSVYFHYTQSGDAMRLVAKRVGWLCLLLTLWLAVATVVHHHAKATESAKCTVCVASHSATTPTQFIAPKAVFVFASVVRLKPLSAKQRLFAFALSVRPPPAA